MKKNIAIAAIIFSAMFINSCSTETANNANVQPFESQEVKYPLLEGYPLAVIESLEAKEQQLELLTSGMDKSRAGAIISASRTWKPGKTIMVAFSGGDPDLRQQIAEGIRPWSDAANLNFDFGYSSQANTYREWSSADTGYKADIRIAFLKGQDGGYWSAVGRDSINKTMFRPGDPSMNFEGFDEILPEDWQAILIHEFGHAIGFEHEHQSPNSSCETEYRWDDDPGYIPTKDQHQQFVRDNQGRRPGIYTILGGAPNYWSQRKVDFNLRKFANSTDWFLTSFDRLSIMKYHFSSWMYQDLSVSTSSGCYSDPSSGLSTEDRRAALAVYPRTPSDIRAVTDERADISREVISRKDVSKDLKDQYKINLK